MKRLLALACVLCLFAGACDDDDEPVADPTFPVTTAPAGSATPDIRGLPTKTGPEATVVATDYELVPYTHESEPRREGTDIIDFSYEILIPEGWATEQSGVTLTTSVNGVNDFPYASVSVDCRPGMQKEEMLDGDARATDGLNLGDLSTKQPQSGLVGEREALLVEWQGSGAFPAAHYSAYVDGKDCAWRLQLNTFAAVRIADFQALFEEMLARFDPSQGLPEGFVPAR